MRDYRDAKAMAQTLRTSLAARKIKLSVGESLELIAKLLGFPDWNTLSAAIKAAPKDAAAPPAAPAVEQLKAIGDTDFVADSLERVARLFGFADRKALSAALAATPKDQAPAEAPAPALDQLARALGATDFNHLMAAIRAKAPAELAPAPATPPEPRRTGTRFSAALEATLHKAVALAAARRHQYTTLEHLLLALVDDPDASAVLEACLADRDALRAGLTRHIDEQLTSLVMKDGEESPGPTAGFHRVVQRAVIHVQSSGRGTVTGANLLVAVFSERESHAAHFLQAQRMDRFDAVNFIAHGVRKGDAAA